MSLSPIFAPQARLLILGTYPSPKSREHAFYYGHAQNRFWPMLARLFGAPTPHSVEEKRALRVLIEENELALWDTIAACTITGASDASIRNVVPNDIAALCRTLPIERVLCNGATAYRLYEVYHGKKAGCPPAVQLPSTSPANAAWGMDRLCEAWGQALELA